MSRKLRYSVDCFRCKSSKDKDCKESCGPSVQYKPRKENITGFGVRVNGLQSDSFFLFRVYSVNELNQQEKDRDKWNYATVFARTKGENMFYFDVVFLKSFKFDTSDQLSYFDCMYYAICMFVYILY